MVNGRSFEGINEDMIEIKDRGIQGERYYDDREDEFVELHDLNEARGTVVLDYDFSQARELPADKFLKRLDRGVLIPEEEYNITEEDSDEEVKDKIRNRLQPKKMEPEQEDDDSGEEDVEDSDEDLLDQFVERLEKKREEEREEKDEGVSDGADVEKMSFPDLDWRQIVEYTEFKDLRRFDGELTDTIIGDLEIGVSSYLADQVIPDWNLINTLGIDINRFDRVGSHLNFEATSKKGSKYLEGFFKNLLNDYSEYREDNSETWVFPQENNDWSIKIGFITSTNVSSTKEAEIPNGVEYWKMRIVPVIDVSFFEELLNENEEEVLEAISEEDEEESEEEESEEEETEEGEVQLPNPNDFDEYTEFTKAAGEKGISAAVAGPVWSAVTKEDKDPEKAWEEALQEAEDVVEEVTEEDVDDKDKALEELSDFEQLIKDEIEERFDKKVHPEVFVEQDTLAVYVSEEDIDDPLKLEAENPPNMTVDLSITAREVADVFEKKVKKKVNNEGLRQIGFEPIEEEEEEQEEEIGGPGKPEQTEGLQWLQKMIEEGNRVMNSQWDSNEVVVGLVVPKDQASEYQEEMKKFAMGNVRPIPGEPSFANRYPEIAEDLQEFTFTLNDPRKLGSGDFDIPAMLRYFKDSPVIVTKAPTVRADVEFPD